MTPDSVYQRLLEISWRRKLSDAEAAELQACLAAHPEVQAEWMDDANLNELLEALPVAPVPSNFTSRVLQELERQEAAEGQAAKGKPSWRFWDWRLRLLPRAGLAAIVLGSGLLVYHQHQLAVKTEQITLGSDLATLAAAGGAMPSEVLTNYDAIRLMTAVNAKPTADADILRLLE
jgi:anti-sigma factor RsiW